MAPQRPSPVLATAMPSPIFDRLKDKRVVLASGSPRRKDIFENVGFKPEIIPSTFEEDLSKADFEGHLADYPIATAGEKVSCGKGPELTAGDGGVRAPDAGERQGPRADRHLR